MVYLVEDDDSIRELVVYTLNNSQIPTVGFDRPSLFLDALKDTKPDMVLLDIMLPEINGIDVLKMLRGNRETAEIPIIMLTAKDSEYDKVLGLDSGADDYMTKPIAMMEMISRVNALLRRTVRQNQREYEYRQLRINIDSHLVMAGDAVVLLTLKEFELLEFFLKNIGSVLTRDELLERIWGYSFDGESRTVDVHIRTLRKKLKEYGNYIQTIRGVGYKMG